MSQAYYERIIHGTKVDLYDICDAWDLDRWTTQVIQYVLRSKYKEDELVDLEKSVDFITHRIEQIRKERHYRDCIERVKLTGERNLNADN